MIGPDHDTYSRAIEDLGRCLVVGGRDDDYGTALFPLTHKCQYLVGRRELAVDEDGVGSRGAVSMGPIQGFVQAQAEDESFNSGDDTEVAILLRILGGLDLAGKFLSIGEELMFLIEERIGLGKHLVLDAHGRDIALLELVHQAAHIVEVSVSSVSIQEDRNAAGIAHQFHDLQHLGPTGFIAVAHSHGGGQSKTTGPNPLEARFFDQLRSQAVMGFHQKLQLPGMQKSLELSSLFGHIRTMSPESAPGVTRMSASRRAAVIDCCSDCGSNASTISTTRTPICCCVSTVDAPI